MTKDASVRDERKFSITSSLSSEYRLYWQGNCWSASVPSTLMTSQEVDVELRRLRAARPYDKTIQRVDSVEVDAMSKLWSEKLEALLSDSGYGAIPLQERSTPSAKALRSRAVLAADQMLREAGYPDFQGWSEWTFRMASDVEPNPEQWTVSVWDGYTNSQFPRTGTYEQVARSCEAYPPSYIWSVSRTSGCDQAMAIREVEGPVADPCEEEPDPSACVPRPR